MEHIPKSGTYTTNKFACITLEGYEKVIGKKGVNDILDLAGLGSLSDHYPPDNLEYAFDFADFTAFQVALEERYGRRGSRGIALRAGRTIFNDALRNYGALAGIGDQAFQELPLQTRIRIGLPASAKILSKLTNQLLTVNEMENAFIWTTQRCPVCWNRSGAGRPICDISTGLLQSMLTWITGGLEYHINETKCCAVGDNVCEFVIRKEPFTQ
jgi:predicted hydrocarbon binding protein